MASPDASIHVVFFDAAGTLFRVKRSVADIYFDLAVPYGFRRGPDSREAIKGAFKRAMQDAPPPAFQVTDPAEIKRCERLWWFDVVHNVFYRVGMFDRFDDFFEEVFRRFDGPEFWELYPETIDALKGLRDPWRRQWLSAARRPARSPRPPPRHPSRWQRRGRQEHKAYRAHTMRYHRR